MRQPLKMEVLDALRDSLRGLDNLKIVRADDPDILALREHLREKIAELENDGSEEFKLEMAA